MTNTNLDAVVNQTVRNQQPQLHILWEGVSYDVDLGGENGLDIGDLSSDTDVRAAAAQYLDAPVSKLANFTVDRNTETGDMTLRPQAVFGVLD